MRVLLVPSIKKSDGTGHIRRCIELARELGSGAALYVPVCPSSDTTKWTVIDIRKQLMEDLDGIALVTGMDNASSGTTHATNVGYSIKTKANIYRHSWDLIVMDCKESTIEECLAWKYLAPVVSLDEGGPARLVATYLIDILPHLAYKVAANFEDSGLVQLPICTRKPPAAIKKILVTFAGTRALAAVQSLAACPCLDAPDISILCNSHDYSQHSRRHGSSTLSYSELPLQKNLRNELYKYDLVISYFGFTAIEAAFAGCAVILVNPTQYHEKLARSSGFPVATKAFAPHNNSTDQKKLKRLLADLPKLCEQSHSVAPLKTRSLAAVIESITFSGTARCPQCFHINAIALHRNVYASFFRCQYCKIIYAVPLRSKAVSDSDYFASGYAAQYGKTYLEDWSNLTGLAQSRLEIIEKLHGQSSGIAVLDVGCALGPFLAQAKAHGHMPTGTDISAFACEHITRTLGIEAINLDFQSKDAPKKLNRQFDVLAMWYVIEHFEDLHQALANAAQCVKAGGIFSFSTPSGLGISMRSNRQDFFNASPQDHFTIFEPCRMRTMLRTYGFRLAKIKITGHHPERFPIYKKLFLRNLDAPCSKIRGIFERMCFRFLAWYSKRVGLGDTFEVYCIRKP